MGGVQLEESWKDVGVSTALSLQSAPLPAIDVFAGAGGLSLGLVAAGFVPIVASEMEKDALGTYSAAHAKYLPGASLELLAGDIKDHDFRTFRGNVAIVAGGPPCQPYSLGGHRRGEDDTRDGIPEFVRVVREVQPDAFLMENVPGLASGAQKSRLQAILIELESLGYDVEWRLLRAADFGVSQLRKRLIIVGTRGGAFRWPSPSNGQDAPAPWIAAREVLDMGKVLGDANDSKVTFALRPDLRPSPWDGHLWNGGGRPINPDGLAPTLLATMGGNKTPWIDGLGIVPEYHAHLQSGGKPRVGVVPGARRITVLEAARVQTFPDDMPWVGSRSSRYRQIGNAVPVCLAKAIGDSMAACVGFPSGATLSEGRVA